MQAKRQIGIALIEFALVLPLLLVIAAGIAYYGYAFVITSAVEDAARNAAQGVVAVSPLAPAYGSELLIAKARVVVASSLAWLPVAVTDSVSVTMAGECAGKDMFGIHVLLPLTTEDGGALPQFSLGQFKIPPLPTTIDSLACATI